MEFMPCIYSLRLFTSIKLDYSFKKKYMGSKMYIHHVHFLLFILSYLTHLYANKMQVLLHLTMLVLNLESLQQVRLWKENWCLFSAGLLQQLTVSLQLYSAFLDAYMVCKLLSQDKKDIEFPYFLYPNSHLQ